MGLVRCVVFVSLPTIHQYEAMGHKVGQSRSSLMRFALESGLADLRTWSGLSVRFGRSESRRSKPFLPIRKLRSSVVGAGLPAPTA